MKSASFLSVRKIHMDSILTDRVTCMLCQRSRYRWHIHHAKKGSGQILLVTARRGYYQEYGKEPLELHPGDVVNIPAGVKHWHGASKDSWFAHLAIEVPAEDGGTEWCEPVDAEDYERLK